VFNIRYLRTVDDWIDYQGFDFVFWNMLHDAWYFNISTLPESAKTELSAYLDNCNPPEKFKKEFSQIKSFMLGGVSSDGSELYKKITETDLRRNQCFSTTFPEMAAILNFNMMSE
jgi:hypothetical protein